jgi:hypothetical protein
VVPVIFVVVPSVPVNVGLLTVPLATTEWVCWAEGIVIEDLVGVVPALKERVKHLFVTLVDKTGVVPTSVIEYTLEVAEGTLEFTSLPVNTG